ncbi:MAG: 4-hydroxyphenylpyruvate dioxygenase [Myxococcales bacterium]|nr:4-hydroxyphenylpyruvate dioxygenase [Myxococcales bacterium]
MTTTPSNPTPNPLALQGIEFVEFASPDPDALHALFLDFGFSRIARHGDRAVDLYVQNDIHFLLNREPASVGAGFARLHGPSICAMGWRTQHAEGALHAGTTRGAQAAAHVDYARYGVSLPALSGIGGSLIYLIDRWSDGRLYESMGFIALDKPDLVPDKGFLTIDHLTNNVVKGTMAQWANFYKDVFGFTEVRYFDIRGAKTGLVSYALRSPCGTFCSPINEATEPTSQIQEYIDEYKGPGIQHLAFLTGDILASLRALQGSRIDFLDIDEQYYREIWQRVPGVTEDRDEIAKRAVLVDGDDDGYLLQIFTKPVVGPIFIEIIQRKNHLSFGEGNFGALFRSMERDQQRRGVLGA